MKLVSTSLAISLIFLQVGCAGWPHPKPSPESLEEQRERESMEYRLEQAEQLLEKLDYKGASAELAIFEQNFPISNYSNRLKIDKARASLGLGDFSGSLNILNEVIQTSLAFHPEFVAQAAYYSSYAYEGLGDETKSLASLLDAEKGSQYLTSTIAYAELPVRLAVAYNRIHDFEKAKRYFMEAQQGIETEFRGVDPESKQRRAQNYFLMGHFPSEAMRNTSPQIQIESLEFTQFFALRAIEEKDPVWSPKASEDLQRSYGQVWNNIMKIDDNQIENPKETQRENLSRLQTAIEKLRALSIPRRIKMTTDLFVFLNKLETQAQVLIVQSHPITPLTKESESRQGLKRAGVVHSVPVFKNEKQKTLNLPEKGSPAKLTPDDPNIEAH